MLTYYQLEHSGTPFKNVNQNTHICGQENTPESIAFKMVTKINGLTRLKPDQDVQLADLDCFPLAN